MDYTSDDSLPFKTPWGVWGQQILIDIHPFLEMHD
jgi:hypothetical protein